MSHPTPSAPPTIAIVGAGPAGLMAAEVAAAAGLAVTLFDRMPSAGRKILLAGRGGLNITHSEPLDRFLTRYGAAADRLRPALEAFPPEHLRRWCEALGQPTFVGSSGRVFPAAFKTSPLLRAWLQRLDASGVRFRPRHRWTGWGEDRALCFETPAGPLTQAFDAVVLALGGASWPHLGGDGSWVALLLEAGVAVAPLVPSNCGLRIDWSELFRDRFEGQPLKAIRLGVGPAVARGDAVVTRAGLEGGAVYALSAAVRDAVARDGSAEIRVALRPDVPVEVLARRLAGRLAKTTFSAHLRKALHLSPAGVGLLQEAAHKRGTPLSALDPVRLAAAVNDIPLVVVDTTGIERAISSAGGVGFSEIEHSFMLRRRPGVFVAGEMIDWEAPTGGYLLQACFATGAAAGRAAADYATASRLPSAGEGVVASLRRR